MIGWSSLQNLPLEKKVSLLYEHAAFVMAIRYYKHKINLYLLGSDYIEVFVNHKYASIERINLLDPTHSRMKFYSDQIKLPAIN
ncbi:MAG: hypothetical protein KF775_14590 [Cyclobacteriaceae bacterium]|nr:hypothetical protein [Cytophagales bacterium]MBX2900877.1 hypothetical protein [Cyclobacteriaceae bacterium]